MKDFLANELLPSDKEKLAQWQLWRLTKHPDVQARRAHLPEVMPITTPQIGTMDGIEVLVATEPGTVCMQLTPAAMSWLTAAVAHQCEHPSSVQTQQLRKHRLARKTRLRPRKRHRQPTSDQPTANQFASGGPPDQADVGSQDDEQTGLSDCENDVEQVEYDEGEETGNVAGEQHRHDDEETGNAVGECNKPEEKVVTDDQIESTPMTKLMMLLGMQRHR